MGGADEEIVIEAPDLTPACTGSGVSVELSVSGGRAPYRWRPVSLPTDFVLKAQGARATVVATPATPGDQHLVVAVMDDDNREVERRFTVSTSETPVIRVSSVPSICPNEIYSFELTAEGGDASQYVWSTTLPEQTGLVITGNRLEGRFAGAARGTTSLDFALDVADAHCAAASAQLTLELESPTATACPAIDVSSGFPGTPPPPPCLGNPYGSELVVRRGTAPYAWEAMSLPDGLAFDVATQKLSGVSLAPGTLAVRVTDANERTIEASYELRPRDKCWFAYLSSEAESSRLELFDPLLGNRRSFPASRSAAPVIDFKFSPSGHFLAYRLGAPNATEQLAVVELATWHEQLLDFGAVKRYVWSNDSSALAVAFDTSEGSFLGGVDVARAEDGPFPQFEPIATTVDSEPVWFSGVDLGFLSIALDPLLYLTTAERTAVGFAPTSVRLENLYLSDTQLKVAARGLFAVPQTGAIAFYGADGSLPVLHDSVTIAPSGRYAARAREHELQLFRDIDSSYASDASPRERLDGCDTLLAWASGRERIACVHRTPDLDNELWIVDIDPRSDVPRLLSSVRGDFLYPEGAHAQRRRLFSPSGARLAFSTDDFVHVAELDEGTPIAKFNIPLSSAATPPNNAFAELSFSPNELLLLQHRGARLSFFDLRDPALGEVALSDALVASVRCEEDFRNVSGGWCGAERPRVPFTWSPNSEMAAFQTALGTLEIYDFKWLSFREFSQIPVNEHCDRGCVVDGEFGFQP